MRKRPSAVVTGLGLVLPHGVGLQAADAVFRGESAVACITGINGPAGATAAALAEFTPPDGTAGADRAIQFAVAAAEEAWLHAGLSADGIDPERVAVVLTLSKGCILALARRAGLRRSRRAGMASGGAGGRDFWFQVAPDAAARTVAGRLGVRGPVETPVTACASGGHALLWGVRLIERGVVDIALAGAAEASIHPLIIGSYRRMGVLAPAGDDPAASVRPFSSTRRGFAIGEGAGVVVLESAESAERRGARTLGRVSGWASGSHAASLTHVEADGTTLARLMQEALRRARVEPGAVDYVHAHGTATVPNDLAEARAIRRALLGAEGVSVSSTKGAHGHLLGAATAVETVLTILAMERQEVPPTANLTDPDPAIGLDCTPLRPRRRPIRHALKIASGFGGQSLALCLSAATTTSRAPAR
ncbi:MAG: beta-ketoacyl-[acyl-carrier-protein] synthase family protein [Phycisphaerae bacterium]